MDSFLDPDDPLRLKEFGNLNGPLSYVVVPPMRVWVGFDFPQLIDPYYDQKMVQNWRVALGDLEKWIKQKLSSSKLKSWLNVSRAKDKLLQEKIMWNGMCFTQ